MEFFVGVVGMVALALAYVGLGLGDHGPAGCGGCGEARGHDPEACGLCDLAAAGETDTDRRTDPHQWAAPGAGRQDYEPTGAWDDHG